MLHIYDNGDSVDNGDDGTHERCISSSSLQVIFVYTHLSMRQYTRIFCRWRILFFFARRLFLFRHKISDVWCFNKSSKQWANLFFSFFFSLFSWNRPSCRRFSSISMKYIFWFIYSSVLFFFYFPFMMNDDFFFSFDIVCCCVCPLLPPCLFLCLWCLLHQCVKNIYRPERQNEKVQNESMKKKKKKKRWKVRRTQCVQCGNRISDFNYVFFFVVSIFILFFCIDFFYTELLALLSVK